VTDALSIAAAAREAPDALALATRDREVTYAELAATTRALRFAGDRLVPIVAHPSIETVVAILAALEQRRPIALLHPRLDVAAEAAAREAITRHTVPDGTLAVVFTSGTTAAPRGVVLTRAGLLAAADASAQRLGWRDDDRWLVCLPLAHTGGLAAALRCVIARRPVVLHDAPFDAPAVAELARARRATLTSLVPTQLDALIGHLPPLRAVLLGGAAASPSLLDRAAAAGVPVHRTYGLTEAWGQVATQTAPGNGPLIPLPGVTVTAGTRDAPARITIDGPAITPGMLGEPPRDGPLVTSDLGWLDARGLHVVGRADDVIVTGGENVHPAEVEAAIADAPGVAAACAFGIPDARWGQLVACAIVPRAGFDRARLDAWLAANLPPHLRPRRIELCAALPLLPTGKVDRRAVATATPPG